MNPSANRIRELRKSLGWSQAELAKRAGLKSVGHLSNLETGKKASAAACIQIARVLGVTLEELGVTFPYADVDSNAVFVENVLQRKSAAGPPKPRFGNLPPIRPDHASSSRRIPCVRADSRLDTRWNPGHTRPMEAFCG